MATNSPTITAGQRWAANDVRVDWRRAARYTDAVALEAAQQAEGFPHSYTPAAVELAQRVIAAAAEYRRDPEASGVLEDLLEDVRELQLSGGWYA